MKYENEITVETSYTYDELKDILKNQNFDIVDDYWVKDVYLLNTLKKGEKDPLELLKNCIIIRDIIEGKKHSKMILYKYKEYNLKREIIKQGKVKCLIEDAEEAIRLFEQIDYKKLINIDDHIIVFSNGEDELAVEIVNEKHIYIEIEETSNRINKKYESIDDMKKVFTKYNIPIKNDDYFVKKAEIEINESC